jgi:hypothetical protein
MMHAANTTRATRHFAKPEADSIPVASYCFYPAIMKPAIVNQFWIVDNIGGHLAPAAARASGTFAEKATRLQGKATCSG